MYKRIIENLKRGDISCLSFDVILSINNNVMALINKEPLTPQEISDINDILHISNIVYNNTDRSVLVLEDGVYDLLLQKYKKYDANYQIGAEPIHFDQSNSDVIDNISSSPYTVFDINAKDMLYYNNIAQNNIMPLIKMPSGNNDKISKRLRNTSHKYDKLVGTLDKAKFTLDKEAIDKGVYNDDNIQIFERDFLRKHIENGITNMNNITLVMELKYDGVSIEAEVTDNIISARTRGDTGLDQASDLTPIFNGYPFKNASGYNIEPFGMKFEAIINKYALQMLSNETGKVYANSRNAVIGILSSSDAYKYTKYITLVPLATSREDMNRVEELEFMNKYYSNGEICRYAVASGDYNSVLFQVYQFVKEAEMLRDYIPFMYDGVVISYLDEGIRKSLGRKNHVNLYSIAIKFNTKKKFTRFLGYSYTVGQDGTITPMIHYNPVEFYGNIQTKSSGHSFGRFKELSLRNGDIIQIEYVNDVMAYVSRANIQENNMNRNPIIPFIDTCPECGTKLVVSETGKNVLCPNMDCKGRIVSRLTNMLKKLNFKGFSEETVKTLGITSFSEFMELTPDMTSILGEVNSNNLIQSIENFKNTPIQDFNIIGALGFTSMASIKWKKVLNIVSLKDIIDMNSIMLMSVLSNSVKGISYATANTVVKERTTFMKDLQYIYNMPNLICTTGNNNSDIKSNCKSIRFTGIRDNELEYKLKLEGHDVSDGSVTKSTDILVIPYVGFSSSKVNTAQKYIEKYGSNIIIVPIDEFRNNQDLLLSKN